MNLDSASADDLEIVCRFFEFQVAMSQPQNLSDFASKVIPLTLTGNNFQLGRNEPETALKARIKMGFINGNIEEPEIQEPTYQDWEECDNLVKTWIANCLSQEISISVFMARISRELWLDLKTRYSESDPTTNFEIIRSSSSMKQGGSNVNEYYAKMKTLWDELDQNKQHPIYKCGRCVCALSKSVHNEPHMQKVPCTQCQSPKMTHSTDAVGTRTRGTEPD